MQKLQSCFVFFSKSGICIFKLADIVTIPNVFYMTDVYNKVIQKMEGIDSNLHESDNTRIKHFPP